MDVGNSLRQQGQATARAGVAITATGVVALTRSVPLLVPTRGLAGTPGGALLIIGATLTAAGGNADLLGHAIQAAGGVNRRQFAIQATFMSSAGALGFFLGGTPGAAYLAGITNALVLLPTEPAETNARCNLDG